MLTPVKEYHKSTEGSRKVSKNFTVLEFACKDGSDRILIDTYLVSFLQFLRDYYKLSININSAYRTPEYNKKIGGASESQHVEGKAVDFVVTGKTPKEIYDYLDKVLNWDGGLGLYSSFVHIDTGSKRRWRG